MVDQGHEFAASDDTRQSALSAPSDEASPQLGPFLLEWLSEIVERSVRPKTCVSHRSIVERHLIPGLGDIRLDALRAADVQRYLNAKSQTKLAPRTIAYHRNVLRQALGHAERTELISRNVAKLAVPPRIPRREVHPLTSDQARVFLAPIEGEPNAAIYLVAIGVGLRQGEILGLRWSDLDLEAGTIRVRAALQRVHGVFRLVEPN
jgi:integrase